MDDDDLAYAKTSRASRSAKKDNKCVLVDMSMGLAESLLFYGKRSARVRQSALLMFFPD